jgi:hypothetical protein
MLFIRCPRSNARSRFDRAAARDFIDVHALGRPFSKAELLDLAPEVDAGFDIAVFTDMLRHLTRYGDVDLARGGVRIHHGRNRPDCVRWIATSRLR